MTEKSEQLNETRDDVKEVHSFNVKRIPLSPFFQKNAKVSGKPSSAITGHHHTDVVMESDDMQLQSKDIITSGYL